MMMRVLDDDTRAGRFTLVCLLNPDQQGTNLLVRIFHKDSTPTGAKVKEKEGIEEAILSSHLCKKLGHFTDVT